jgi:1,4-dihydroxy-2-naphthoate octaprenyltransferase
MMKYVALFLRMARPPQLLAITLVFSWGILMSLVQGSLWSSSSYFLGLLAAILISISIHYVNEYADYETDFLTSRTLFSGGSGAFKHTGLDKNLALVGAIPLLILGFTVAFFGIISGNLSREVGYLLGVAALFGWGYSLKPMALAWRGWGELDNALLGGLLLPIFGYVVLHHRVDTFIMFAAVPFAMLTFVNLLATHWADRQADQAVGKFTLATKLSVPQLRTLYFAVVLGAYTCVALHSQYPLLVQISSFTAVPVSLWGFVRFTRQHSPAPSVFAMVSFLLVQIASWGYLYVS